MSDKSKKIVIVILTILIAIVLALIFYRKHQSEQRVSLNQEYFTPIDDQNATFMGATYTGDLITDWPKSLPLINIRTVTYDDLAAKVNAYCQIYDADEYGEYYGNLCDYSLYADGHIQMIEFNTDQADVSGENSSALSLERATRAADAFLANFYGDNSHLTMSSFTELVCEGASCYWLEDESLPANAVELTYSRQYQNVPISTRRAGGDYISVLVGANDRIIKVELETNTIDYQVEPESYPLLSISEAVENINNNQAVLYDYDDADFYEDNPSQTVSIDSLYNLNLKSVFLDYQMNDQQTQAVPTYDFFGTAQDINGNVMNVVIYTPAIQFEVASDNGNAASI